MENNVLVTQIVRIIDLKSEVDVRLERACQMLDDLNTEYFFNEDPTEEEMDRFMYGYERARIHFEIAYLNMCEADEKMGTIGRMLRNISKMLANDPQEVEK